MDTERPVPKWFLVILRIPRAIVQNVFKGPLRPLLDWFTRLYLRHVFQSMAHEIFDNINLYYLDDEKKELFFEATIKALKLLRTHDPRRYNRAKKYLMNIAYLPTGNGCFESSTFSYLVDSFAECTPAQFASAIVHEATHGMLYVRGFKYDGHQKQHEVICIREQGRTIRRLVDQLIPDMTADKKEEWERACESWMETSLRSEWWNMHQLIQRAASRLISMGQEESTTPQEVNEVIREKEDGHHFLICNSAPCDVTVTIRVSEIKNGRMEVPSPWTKTLPPKSSVMAFRITLLNTLEPLNYQHTWDWKYGTPDATHDDSYIYVLPFDGKLLHDGDLNGPPQKQGSSSCWYLPIGTPICAAREGIVMQVSNHYQSSQSQIIIRHPDGTMGSYRGCADIKVKPGQDVKRAEPLGALGDKQVHESTAEFNFYVWKPIDGESGTYFPIKFNTPEQTNPTSSQ